MDRWALELLRRYRQAENHAAGATDTAREIRFDASTIPTRGTTSGAVYDDDAWVYKFETAGSTPVRAISPEALGDLDRMRSWRGLDGEFYEAATGEIGRRRVWGDDDLAGASSAHLRDLIGSMVYGYTIGCDMAKSADDATAVPVEDEKFDREYMEALADSKKKLDSFLEEFTVSENT